MKYATVRSRVTVSQYGDVAETCKQKKPDSKVGLTGESGNGKLGSGESGPLPTCGRADAAIQEELDANEDRRADSNFVGRGSTTITRRWRCKSVISPGVQASGFEFSPSAASIF